MQCDAAGSCFSLEGDKHGCFDCLRRGRFCFPHQTEVGFLEKTAYDEQYLSARADVAEARQGLAEALTAYLS